MPIAYKRCRCGKVIQRNIKMCDTCTNARHKDYNTHRRDETLQSFYNSKEWKAVRKIAIELNPFCVVCNRPANVIDHIKEIRDGGAPLALENLQSLCHACHNKKSAIERERR